MTGPVTPRRPGDPEVDHTLLRHAHRTMLGEVSRMAVLVTDLHRAGGPYGRRRAAAIARHLAAFGAELHEHHRREDEIGWPVVAASAGAAIDLAPLAEDHVHLVPAVDTVVAVARAFGADPARYAGRLARALRELSALLHEHVAEEERDVLPAVSRYVSVADWARVQRWTGGRTGPGGTLRRLTWTLPWLAGTASAAELAQLRAAAGPLAWAALVLAAPGYRRRERLVLGG